MRVRQIVLCGLLGFLCPAVAAAQFPPVNPTLYFSVGAEIRQATLQSVGNTYQLVNMSTIYTASGAFVGDMARCANNELFFYEKAPLNRIRKIDLATSAVDTVFAVAGVREMRLKPTCDVLYATAAGVYQVNGFAPYSALATLVQATGQGSGLGLGFDGSIRASNDPTVVSVNVMNGGAGAVSGMQLLPIGATCYSQSNTVKCTTKTGAPISGLTGGVLASYPLIDLVQYCEALTSDLFACATSVDPDADLKIEKNKGIVHNGTLQLISAPGTSALLLEPFNKGNTAPPVVGLAVGPSASEVVTISPSTAPDATITNVPGVGWVQHVNFGPVGFEVINSEAACRTSFQLRQLPWNLAHSRYNSPNNGNSYTLDLSAGGESWQDTVDLHVTGGVCASSEVRLFQFTTLFGNKAVFHCHEGVCTVITKGNFYGPDTDPPESGDVDVFGSDVLTGNTVTNEHRILFLPKMNNNAVIDGTIDTEIAFAESFSNSGGFSIRFKICADQACTTFLPAEQPSGDTSSGAGLSVTRLDATGQFLAICDVDDSGGANPNRPIFRVDPTDPNAMVHIFNVNTPLLGPPECQAGNGALYLAGVFSLSGQFSKTMVLFKLQ